MPIFGRNMARLDLGGYKPLEPPPVGDKSQAAPWSAISATYPTTLANNEDRAISWLGGGARTITAAYGGGNTLYYRIDAGGWVAYSAGFSLNSGQTVAWRVSFSGNDSSTVTVAVFGAPLSSFNVIGTGYP